MVLLAGPTASGKSSLALRLAERLNGEIVSVDSMQVYRGMDIGTAKPSAAERARVPHHLLDVADVSEPFDAAQFARLAREAVSGICARGRLPILCGGTGLYFKAFLDGVGAAPAPDPALREELRATSLDKLLTELAEKDPETRRRIDARNPRRVIRAVEVLRLTGKPISEQRSVWRQSELPKGCACFGLARGAELLRRRIETRVDRMFQLGLVEETRRLLEMGLAGNIIAMQALGYRQAAEHLAGMRPIKETIELVKARTRQFARRQMTWFRRQMPVIWIPAADEDDRWMDEWIDGMVRWRAGDLDPVLPKPQ